MSWSRRQILSANIYMSAVNFLSPFAIIWSLGAEYLSIWISGRAFVQFFIAFIPTQAHAFLLFSKPINKNRFHLFYSGLYINFFISICAAFSYFFLYIKNGAVVEHVEGLFLVVYLLLFAVSSFSSVIPRIQKRSDILKSLAKVDASLTFFAILLLMYDKNFVLFAVVFSVKEVFKVCFIFIRLGVLNHVIKFKKAFTGSYKRNKFNKVFFSCSLIHVLRSIGQILLQHGDRFLFPLLFDFKIGGQIALGSSIAMIVVILSSSAFSWVLPLVISGQDKKGYLIKQHFNISLFVFIGVVLLISGLYYFSQIANVKLPFEVSLLTISGFLFSSIVGSSFMLFAIERERFLSSFIFIKVIFSLIVLYFIIFIMTSIYSLNIESALSIAAMLWVFFVYLFFGAKSIMFFFSSFILFLSATLVLTYEFI